MNKAKRVLENLTSNEKEKILTALGDISDNADLGRQAQYINEMLNFAETNEMLMQDTLRKCGGSCLNNDVIELAQKIYEQSSTIDEFLSEMNEIGIGGKNLHMKNKKSLQYIRTATAIFHMKPSI